MNELEKYQFEVLKQNVLESGWLDQLTQQYNWSPENLDKFLKKLKQFEQDTNLTYTNFECELRKNFDLDFTDVECIYQVLLQNTQYKFINNISRYNKSCSYY